MREIPHGACAAMIALEGRRPVIGSTEEWVLMGVMQCIL